MNSETRELLNLIEAQRTQIQELASGLSYLGQLGPDRRERLQDLEDCANKVIADFQRTQQ